MTAKRFTITQDFEEHHRQIRDNGKIIMGCFLEPQAEPIVKLLNKLHEENQELKQLKHRLAISKKVNFISALEKENEQLHEENQRLKQYTKQVLQNHLEGWRGVYNPIDESIIVEICVVKSIAEDLGVDLE